MKRIIAGALMSGALGLATLGMGTAQADPATGICNQLGMCSYVWCPGSQLPMPDVV